MQKKKHKRLTNDEREEISRFLASGKPHTEIARLLSRDAGTISREIKRNGRKTGYRAFSASKRAEAQLPQDRKRKAR